MPCHYKLEEFLDAYIKAAGIADGCKGPLFPRRESARRRNSGRARCSAPMSGT